MTRETQKTDDRTDSRNGVFGTNELQPVEWEVVAYCISTVIWQLYPLTW